MLKKITDDLYICRVDNVIYRLSRERIGCYGNGKTMSLYMSINNGETLAATFVTKDDGYGCYKDFFGGKLWTNKEIIDEANKLINKISAAVEERNYHMSPQITKDDIKKLIIDYVTQWGWHEPANKQILSFWTTFCCLNDIYPDAANYDTLIDDIYVSLQPILQSDNINELQSLDNFDAYMCQNLI